jgi:hypothetical protein
MSQSRPADTLVVTYMSEPHYHRRGDDDDMRPACRPERIRGVLAIRRRAEQHGQTACPQCWPPG